MTDLIARFVQDVRAAVADHGKDREAVVAAVTPRMEALAADQSWVPAAAREADEQQGFGIVVLHEEPDDAPGGGFLVETICWAPGRGVAPHDHQTWGIVVGLDGEEVNVDWKRIDDGATPGHADLELAQETLVTKGVVKTFAPNDIHGIRNDSDRPSLSLHVYGRNLARIARSEFNPVAKTQAPCPVRAKKPAA
jgi:predicted metal-dependent enzyme (double-stranded beta helix superfamily)